MYNYDAEKQYIFTDDGQRDFIIMRDHVFALLKESGAIMMENAMRAKVKTCSSWQYIALVDRMVEIGDIVEVTNQKEVAGQYRIFRAPYRSL